MFLLKYAMILPFLYKNSSNENIFVRLIKSIHLRMLNDDILTEIQKLKEISNWTKNKISDIEMKLSKENRNNINQNHQNENHCFNINEFDHTHLKTKNIDEINIHSLESQNSLSNNKDMELIEGLYDRSRKHLEIFQKKCDDLLNSRNSNKIEKKSKKKNDQLYQIYLDYYLDENNLSDKKKNHLSNPNKNNRSAKNPNTFSNPQYPLNHILSDNINYRSSNNFNFMKGCEYGHNFNQYNMYGKPYADCNNINNIDFYKKCTSDTNISDSSCESDSFSQTSKKKYDQGSLVTSNTSTAFDNSYNSDYSNDSNDSNDSDNTDNSTFLKSLYLNGQKVYSNNNIPFHYTNNMNPVICNPLNLPTNFVNKRNHNNMLNNTSTFDTSSISAQSYSLNSESNISDY